MRRQGRLSGTYLHRSDVDDRPTEAIGDFGG